METQAIITITALNLRELGIEKKALDFIKNKILPLNNRLYFHQRHLSKEVLESENIQYEFQSLLHQAFQVSKEHLRFDFIYDNFLNMAISLGVRPANPFMVVFWENKKTEIYKIFNKTYKINIQQ